MATHTKGSHSGGVSVDNIRHRSQKAVDYYKKNVQLIYQDKRESSASPLDAHGHSSTDNLNGSYGDDRRVDFSLMDDDLQEPEDGFLKRGGHRATVHGTGPSSKYTWNNNHNTGYKDKKSPESIVTYSSKRYSRGLNRSNSNSEMDSIEYIDADETSIHNRSIHRDYGSTSSLDMLGSNSVHNDSFFDMLSDFRHVNLDQRSPAPAKLQELLRGGYDRTKGQRHQGEKVSNGSVPNDKQSQDEVDSPRTKSKFKQKGDRKSRAKSITAETRPGIFTKFRGKPEAESGARTPENIDVDVRADERLRSKAFVHFDCQSVGFSILDVINKQSQATTAKNTSTGASAASASSRDSIAQDRDDPDLLADGEEGDNKSNGLVLSCQFFRNELGGEKERTISLGKTSTDQKSSAPSHLPESAINIPSRSPACCGISILDSSPNTNQIVPPHLVLHRGHVIEYYDDGATYYRNYFHGVDHQNYFGIDENLGPVAISIRREKLENRENNLGKADYGQYHYRIIFRTSELTTLRGSIIEDAIPSSGSRLSTSRGVLTKDVLEFVLPEVQTSCLKLGTTSSKTSDQLLKLDEQRLTKTHKVGIMFCKAGQSTEEEMYNNEHSSQAFDEFLTCIGQKVELKGFDKYRAQLDNKTNSTGTHSIYASFNNCEIMFHVSTMLPYTPSNKQQLLRKRHIGNDIVTIVFQEPGALPFTPKTVRSQFQHVFIIVRAHNPCSSSVQYSVAVSRSKDVPPFGPHIPDNAFFPKSSDFAEFILAKVINAENAAHRSEKFTAMATRTRTEYLKDLAQNYVTTNTLDSGSKLSKFGLGSGKKKEKAKQKVIPDMFSTGAIVWNIVAEDMGSKSSHIDCFLGISKEVLIIIEESTRDVIFTIHCGAIIGWTSQATSIRIYYNHGESISFKTQSGEMEEMGEICSRLQAVSYGCETDEMTLRRNGKGQLGFHIETAGIVTDVEKHTFAWEAGIRKGCRLVEICKVASVTLTHDEMVDLLRTSATVKVVVIRPLDDGTARGDKHPSPLKGLTSHFREYRAVNGTSSLNRGYNLHHAHTDPSMASKHDGRGSSFDEGYNTYSIRSENYLRSEDIRHERAGSKDSGSGDYSSIAGSTSSRPWSSRSSKNNSRGAWQDESSIDSGCHGSYLHMSESAPTMTSTLQRGQGHQSTSSGYQPPPPRKASVPFELGVQHGNISHELLKQPQNSKYLLSQGHGGQETVAGRVTGNSQNSSVNLSDMSFSSGSSHNSGANTMNRAVGELGTSYGRAEDGGAVSRKRADVISANNKGRPGFAQKRHQGDHSPLSSENSSPRSSHRNLSGMSSEESLNTRLRPGVSTGTKPLKLQNANNLEEELMRLIDPDLSNTEIRGILVSKGMLKATEKPRQAKLKRTMSEESLHSLKGSVLSGAVDNSLSDVIFSTANKHNHPQSGRPRAGHSTDSLSSTVPLPDSTAGLEWSSLVNVATKAIEGTADKPSGVKPKKSPAKEDKKEDLTKKSVLTGPTSYSSSTPVWRSVVANPQVRIQELEAKVNQLEHDLDKERKENAALEAEVQELRTENERLQEESQTAAAKLRKFTEWFFTTIDRQ